MSRVLHTVTWKTRSRRDNLSTLECEKVPGEKIAMTYVINEPCIGTKDASCVEVCPVDCIHPTPDEPDFDQREQLYIDPEECIDCDACVEPARSTRSPPRTWSPPSGRSTSRSMPPTSASRRPEQRHSRARLSLALRRAGGRLHSRRRRGRPRPKPAAVRPRLVARRLSRAGRRAVAAHPRSGTVRPRRRAPPVGACSPGSSCSGTSAPYWCPSASSPGAPGVVAVGSVVLLAALALFAAATSVPRLRCAREHRVLALCLPGGRDLPCRKRHRRHRLWPTRCRGSWRDHALRGKNACARDANLA